jgi:hypothetical protein
MNEFFIIALFFGLPALCVVLFLIAEKEAK